MYKTDTIHICLYSFLEMKTKKQKNIRYTEEAHGINKQPFKRQHPSINYFQTASFPYFLEPYNCTSNTELTKSTTSASTLLPLHTVCRAKDTTTRRISCNICNICHVIPAGAPMRGLCWMALSEIPCRHVVLTSGRVL